jgi:hypothetical protein
MIKHDQVPVELPENASGAPEDKSKDSVSYESYQKALKEKKSFQSKAAEYESLIEQLRHDKALAEGNKDEVITTLKKQTDELKAKLDNTSKSFAWSTLTGEVKREAMKHGCKDPDKLIRLMSDDDLRSIEVGENFSINSESLKEVIEKNKKENHFLFESSYKQAVAGTPSKIPPVESKKEIKDMTLDELRSLYKTIK